MEFFHQIYLIQLIYADRFGVSSKYAWIFASAITGIIFFWTIQIFIKSLYLIGLDVSFSIKSFTLFFIGTGVGVLYFYTGEKYLRIPEKYYDIENDRLAKIEKTVFAYILVVTLLKFVI